MDIRISIDDARARAALERAPALVERRLEDALARGAIEMAGLGRRKAPTAFSPLTNSIRAERVEPLHFLVSPGVNYARFVEEGRRPGKQPGTAFGLMEWVREKTKLAGKALDRRTFVIAIAIGRRGIKAQPYMQPAFEEGAPRVIQLARDAVARACEECNA